MSQIGPENPPAQLRGTNARRGEEPKTTEPRKSSLEMRLHPRLHAALAMKLSSEPAGIGKILGRGRDLEEYQLRGGLFHLR